MPPVEETEQHQIAKDFWSESPEKPVDQAPTANQEEPPKKQDVEPEDEEPDFKREPKQVAQKTEKQVKHEESAKALREQRDQLQQNLQVIKDVFGEADPSAFKPFVEFILDRSEGVVTPESIQEILQEIQSKDEKISEFQVKLDEKEKYVSELDIRYSEEFKTQYLKPAEEAQSSLLLEFATISPDGKIIGPVSTRKLIDFLTKTPDLDGIKVKGSIEAFRKEYKEETGEDPAISGFTSIMNSLREYQSKNEKLQSAYENWSEEKKKSQEQSALQAEQEREASAKRNKRERSNLSTKAFREFDIDDFMDESEVQSFFKEEYDKGEKIFNGEDIPPYDQMISRGVKARLWDKYKSKLKELIDLEKLVKKNTDSGIRKTVAFDGDKKTATEGDWFGGLGK